MEKNIHVQARAVIIRENHILLCQTKGLDDNFYFLPGGHIEHGEPARAAMARELQEEIGHDFIVQRFLGCLEYSFDPTKTKHAKCHTHDYTFIFEAKSHSLNSPGTPLDQFEDHIHIAWIPLEHLLETNLRPGVLKELIPTWFGCSFDSAFQSDMVSSEKH